LKKKWIIPVIIVLSLVFNFGFAFAIQNTDHTSFWLFEDIGPAVMQDSYYIRAPGLESPYGIIGDVPGGYPLYSGNPLQPYSPHNKTDWQLRAPAFELDTVILVISFAIVPLGIILILGRRSYGSTKTQ
jgi:hypothetical protein